jgi:hypothetical protein
MPARVPADRKISPPMRPSTVFAAASLCLAALPCRAQGVPSNPFASHCGRKDRAMEPHSFEQDGTEYEVRFERTPEGWIAHIRPEGWTEAHVVAFPEGVGFDRDDVRGCSRHLFLHHHFPKAGSHLSGRCSSARTGRDAGGSRISGRKAGPRPMSSPFPRASASTGTTCAAP